MNKKPDNYEWIFIFGQSFHRAELYKLVAFTLVALSTVFGVLAYVFWGYFFPEPIRDVAVVEAEQIEATEVITKEPDDPLDIFFENHFAATRYNDVESIRALGTYTSGEIELEFKLLAKNPHFYKQTLTYKDRVIEAGYDGERLWYKQSHQILDESDAALLKLNRSLAMLECSIPGLTWEYEKGEEAEGDFQLMPDEVWNERDCLVVKNLGLLDTPVYHYLDKETGLELYRRSSVQIDARRRKDVEIVYAAPLEGCEYPMPSGFELWLDGVLYCTAKFDKIEFNKGLPDFLFEAKE